MSYLNFVLGNEGPTGYSRKIFNWKEISKTTCNIFFLEKLSKPYYYALYNRSQGNATPLPSHHTLLFMMLNVNKSVIVFFHLTEDYFFLHQFIP